MCEAAECDICLQQQYLHCLQHVAQLGVHTAASKSVQANMLPGKPVLLGDSLEDRQMHVHQVLYEILPCRMYTSYMPYVRCIDTVLHSAWQTIMQNLVHKHLSLFKSDFKLYRLAQQHFSLDRLAHSHAHP